MSGFIDYLINFFGELNYISIFFLMALESSIFPIPSEAVMIPAGYLASIGKLDIFLVVLAGTFGSLFGAICNYFILGKMIGKPFLLKYGKYILIPEKKYLKAEDLFLKNDKLYTFIGRLLPVIRHLISIPAGIFKMNFFYFCIITTLGAGVWCGILTGFGFYFGEGILEIFHKYTHEISIGVVLVFITWFMYFVTKKD